MYETPPPLLLSRVAESAYWAGRYLERAEGTARLIKSHTDLVIDLPRSASVGWWPLMAVIGGESPLDDHSGEEAVVTFLTADATSQSSVRSSIAAVHRNLRITRAVMPIEAAEVLTDLHHRVESTAFAAVDRRTRGAWLLSVIRGCQTLSGILAETMSHDDAYCFFTVGRRLERADLVSRILDVHADVLTGHPNDALLPYSAICWTAALRSVSALQAFRRNGIAPSGPTTVSFLLRDPKCPRTVSSCLIESSRWLLEIPGHEAAMAACAEAEKLIQEADVDALVEGGVGEFVDELQLALGNLHDQIEATWFAPVHAALSNT